MRCGIGRTDTGSVRDNNEDSILVCNEKKGLLPNVYAVADGMGGHQAGEVASKSAIDFFCDYLLDNTGGFRYTQDLLSDALAYANSGVFRLSLESEDRNGMGTTFSAFCVDENNIYYAHIGDSRIYRISKDYITQITSDHSYVNELVINGEITKDEAARHPRKNVVTRALGTESYVKSDSGYLPIKREEFFLVCSDGFTDMVPDEEIFKTVNSDIPLSEKVDKLVDMALANGGIDNISIILVSAE